MTPSSGHLWALRLAAHIAGLLLLAAAVYVLYRNRDELEAAWHAARSAPAWMLPAILCLPLANWVLTSTIFWTLTRRHGRVRPWEMAALIGSAWLLNMLPFKPGFVGRMAYHKAISRIPIRVSLLVTLIALLTGGVGVLVSIAVQIGVDPSLKAAVPAGRLAPIGAFILIAATIPGFVLWKRMGEAQGAMETAVGSHLGDVAIAIGLRIAETHLWALRYWLAFDLIGQGQPYGVCVVVSGVSQIVGQSPIQFGLREWAVGVSTSVLRGGAASPIKGVGAVAAVPGITVDFLCRAAEIACAVPVGVVSYIWVHRRLTRAQAEAEASGKLTRPSGRISD